MDFNRVDNIVDQEFRKRAARAQNSQLSTTATDEIDQTLRRETNQKGLHGTESSQEKQGEKKEGGGEDFKVRYDTQNKLDKNSMYSRQHDGSDVKKEDHGIGYASGNPGGMGGSPIGDGYASSKKHYMH